MDRGVSVAGFYRFTPIADPQALAMELRHVLDGLAGTVLLAHEGINGTLAGHPERVDDAVGHLRTLGLIDGHLRRTRARSIPFERLLVRVRAEIVSFDPEVVVRPEQASHLAPEQFEALAGDPDVCLVDTRNRYEVRMGRFRGALDPAIDTFRDFKSFVARTLDPKHDRRIALYCTGGIRCEKAAAWMQGQGFDDVVQLDGGILGYFDACPGAPAWQGDCFVFDRRIGVDRSGAENGWVMCHGCRAPVSPAEQYDRRYEEGVSCPHCANALSAERRARLRARFEFRTGQHGTPRNKQPRGLSFR